MERALKITVVAGLFAGLCFTPKLWFGARLYPHSPVFPFPLLPAEIEVAVYAVMLVTLIAIALVARPAKLIAVFAALAVVMTMFDQSRLQPWLYQYLIMLIALAVYGGSPSEDDRNPALNTCRLVMICVYFWSGIQKVHTDFMVRGFPLLLAPYTRFLPHPIAALMDSSGFIVPFIEIVLGIGLLSRPFRNSAVIGVVVMHGFILAAVGPLGLGHNAVIWPWNVAMPVLVVLLFWRKPTLSNREILWGRMGYQTVVLLLLGIAPLLSFFGLWDGYLSFALYAGNRNEATLYVNDALAARLPREIQTHLLRKSQRDSLNVVFLNEWSLSELGVPDYPEPRIYKSVAKYICTYEQQPSEVKLVLLRRRVLFSPDTNASYDCAGLANAQ